MWQQVAPATTFTWPNAVAYCPALTLGGFRDWRVPAEIELVSLLDDSVASPGPTINVQAFPGTAGAVYWSSSPASASMAWAVDFSSGSVSAKDYFNETTGAYFVRCVR